MPYFMHPSVYYKGLHKGGCGAAYSGGLIADGGGAALDAGRSTLDSAAKRRRRFRIGFFGTHDREFYTQHYHFPGMNRFEILEVFLQEFGQRMTRLRGGPRDWEPCEIAVSIDGRGGDRQGKSFLSKEHYFAALRECDFVLSPPGWCMPVSHNLIEAMFCGAIPITNGGAFMAEPLTDGVNCLEFEDEVGLVSVIERALAMDSGEVELMRRAVLEYYNRFLEPKAFAEELRRSDCRRVFVNAEENSVPLLFPENFNHESHPK
jgi:glycosyltransferase involved in cell wall biosynthesis